ncbi:hypothetical protein [Microbacterium sp. NPDC056052]|uniref:hypothetical protein n=1 Tax=Microbacterium sp. NPDC056052 TaxID=3345695 RepID=UPI0035E367F2
MIAYVSIAAFHMRQLLRIPFFVQTALLTPVTFLLMRALGALNSGAIVPGLAWFDASAAGMWATTTTAVGLIGFQRFQGTLELQIFSVRQPSVVFGPLTSAAALIGLIGIPVAVLLQLLLTRNVHLSLSVLLGLFTATVACVASAAVLSAVFVVSVSARAFEPLILTPVWMLVGIVAPFTTLPSWLLPFALAHPLTSAVLVSRQPDVIPALGWAGVSVAVSALYLIVAGFGLRVAIKRARVDGTLAMS